MWPDRQEDASPGVNADGRYRIAARSRESVVEWRMLVMFSSAGRTPHSEPGSPRENGCCDGFIGTLRGELLDGEIHCDLKGVRFVIERRRREYREVRPHAPRGMW